MSQSKIQLSIVVPVYNVEEFLLECLDSIKDSIRNIDAEVLLIDDGSTDNSTAIAKKYSENDERFKYHHKENGGLSDARNYGAARATGKYLAFVDSDDLVTEDMYENMIASAEFHGSELTICNVIRFDSSKSWLSWLHKNVFNDLDESVTNIRDCNNLIYDTTAWNKLILKSFWDNNGFQYPVGWRYEDMPVSLAMHFTANKVGIVHQTGYLWRVRDGVTKSITQENDTSVNLIHRLKMLENMFEYFDEEVENCDELLKTFKYKILNLDIKLFLDEIPYIKKELAKEYVKRIDVFLHKYFDEMDYEELSVIRKQQYYYIQHNKVEELINIIKFGEKQYDSAPYNENKNGTIVLDVPRDLFVVKDRNAKNDFKRSSVKEGIRSVEISENKFIIKGYTYLPRINLYTKGSQTFSAYLINDITGKKVDLDIIATTDKKTTLTKGFLYDKNRDIAKEYCYDWSGFKLILDFEKLLTKGVDNGKYFVSINYDNRIQNGSYILRNYNKIEHNFSNESSVISNGKKATLKYDISRGMIISIEDCLKDTTAFVSLKNEPYEHILYTNKNLEVLEKAGEVLAYTNKIETDGNKCSFKVHFSGKNIDRDNGLQTRLVYLNKASGEVECLSDWISNDDDTENVSTFVIDFDDYNVVKNLYDDNRKVLLEIDNNGTSLITDIITCSFERFKTETDDLRAFICGNEDNTLFLSTKSLWKPEDKSADKRRYMRHVEYPKFMKDPIKKNSILFESVWGEKYNCNPAALYEYINDNYPEYECIWSLNDTHTPIKGRGKRVKRGSREYYKYLATVEFIVENTNMPNTYKKRPEQVEVQTMHGTPFKSFGLDIKDEFVTESSRIKFINRNSRWDYLIAQGEFTKNMAWRWFRYNKTVLETGYPRTDSIFKTDRNKIEQLKKALGIPSDKKIILYAPTWREKNRFEMKLDIEKMRRELSNDYVLLIRLHYFVAYLYDVPEDGSFIFDMSNANKIEDLFPMVDILITDYSSIMFDFSLTKKPMIFFTYDLDNYTNETRGAYFDISKEAPGALARTNDEVINAINNIDDHDMNYGKRIEAFHNKYLTYESDHSSEDVYNAVFVDKVVSKKASVRKTFLKLAKSIVPQNTYSKLRRGLIKHITRSDK